MTEVVVQAELGGLQIAFTELVGSEEGKIDAYLDRCARAIGRQRSKMQLSEKLVDLLAHKKTLAGLPERRGELLVSRARERAGFVEQMQLSHTKRESFQPNQRQRSAMEAFDAETKQKAEALDAEKQSHEQMIPLLEAQISRLRAVIAGRDPNAPLEEELGQMPSEAAA